MQKGAIANPNYILFEALQFSLFITPWKILIQYNLVFQGKFQKAFIANNNNNIYSDNPLTQKCMYLFFQARISNLSLCDT